MRVLQILPGLESGGVERGAVDFARELVNRGHESLVMSFGGRMVPLLEAEGSRHVTFPIHQKSVKSLFRIKRLRQLLHQLQPDIIHVRSRVPAWMVWLALGKKPVSERPGLVSTFHGLYSINRYSAIMGCGDRVIAISHCVRQYIVDNYPHIDPGKISVVHRGVDTRQFHRDYRPDPAWLSEFRKEYPQLEGKPLLLMPGRLSRWKGQTRFIDLLAGLRDKGVSFHGVIVGEPDPGKEAYLRELHDLVASKRLREHVTFLGHRSDMTNIYALSSLVFNLSLQPEPFGRTVIEALAMGVPVVAFDRGGPAESLRACLPQGLVPDDDEAALVAATVAMLNDPPSVQLPDAFTLTTQADATLEIYRELLGCSRGASAISLADR